MRNEAAGLPVSCPLFNVTSNHVTNAIWADHWNFVKIYLVLSWKIIIESVHNFAHAMTATLSWHVQNYDLIGWLESKSEQTNLGEISIMSLWSVCEIAVPIPVAEAIAGDLLAFPSALVIDCGLRHIDLGDREVLQLHCVGRRDKFHHTGRDSICPESEISME